MRHILHCAAHVITFAAALTVVLKIFVSETSATHDGAELFGPGFWSSHTDATWIVGIMPEDVLGPADREEYGRYASAVGRVATIDRVPDMPDLRDDEQWRTLPANDTALFALRDYLTSLRLPDRRRVTRASVQAAYESTDSDKRPTGVRGNFVWDVIACAHRPGSAWGHCCSLLIMGSWGPADTSSSTLDRRLFLTMRVLSAASLGVVSEGSLAFGPSLSRLGRGGPGELDGLGDVRL